MNNQPPSVTNARANAAQFSYYPPPPTPYTYPGLAELTGNTSTDAFLRQMVSYFPPQSQSAAAPAPAPAPGLAGGTSAPVPRAPGPWLAGGPQAAGGQWTPRATELLQQLRGLSAQAARPTYFPPPPPPPQPAPAPAPPTDYQAWQTAADLMPAPALTASSTSPTAAPGPVLADAIDLLHQIRSEQQKRALADAAELAARTAELLAIRRLRRRDSLRPSGSATPNARRGEAAPRARRRY
ncbi:hypothetical protein MIND_01269600 [Mycena indigotica]|uniref:Uncharacterized protein n=1 Tax=Mycena indigotica TaxID=2126181 RepID=A0A8H6VV52_9AGAR|nr:uncharacterized protein MIND_01269600 [Mycena indigotica]KAF7291258.1 hypothetical protein MIND_01269600 [Mycena indigotica]